MRDKEDEVDNIQTSSRMFEASLLVSTIPHSWKCCVELIWRFVGTTKVKSI